MDSFFKIKLNPGKGFHVILIKEASSAFSPPTKGGYDENPDVSVICISLLTDHWYFFGVQNYCSAGAYACTTARPVLPATHHH